MRIENIQALRGIAVLMVLFNHLGFLFQWGEPWYQWVMARFQFWPGVDLFFAISGFVITRTIREQAQSFLELGRPFWTRRILRIWPASWFWATAALVGSLYIGGLFGAPSIVWRDWLSAVLQYADVHYARCIGDAACAAGSPPLTVFWSLALEEQFYLVLPFLMFFVPRRALIVGLGLLVISQLFLLRPTATVLWYFRTDAIALGALLALWEPHPSFAKLRRMIPRPIATAVTAISLLAMAWLPASGIPSSTGIVATLSALIVYLNCVDAASPNIVRSALARVGARSFSLYLVHIFAIALTWETWRLFMPTMEFAHAFNAAFVATAIAYVVLFTEASYRLIERPTQALGRRLSAMGRPQMA